MKEKARAVAFGLGVAFAAHQAEALQTRTTRVHGPEDFVTGKEICASFANNDLRISQVLNESDIREYVTRLENGGQTYSYLFNAFCDPTVPERVLLRDAFICCRMRAITAPQKKGSP